MSPTALKAMRLDRGLSIRQAAKKMGVHYRVLQVAEKGGTPRPENAYAIASFFDLRVTDIWPAEPPAA